MTNEGLTTLPPIGRVSTGLGVLQLEVVSLKGTIKLNPNTAIMAGHYENLNLGAPFVPSALTGKPGFLYRSKDMQLALTKEELYRFLRHDLTPQEYFALRKQFGTFYEIHEDFYTEDTGTAVNPVPRNVQK